MSDTESLDYLQSGFDPSSLTVPRLRSILVSHNVSYPSSAKKSQLVDLVSEHVLPQSRRILNERARARRTSKGITNADRQETTIADDGDLMPPPPAPKTRSPRKSRVKTEESESDVPLAKSPAKKTPRKSSKHARESDTETGTDNLSVKKTARKSRKSDVVPPEIKVEEDTRKVDNRAFSNENPFQSGSSPLSAPRTPSGERRHKSLGTSEARKKTTIRRQTQPVQADDGIVPPTSSSFSVPISQLNGLPKPADEALLPSEEFTPEEQMELVRERSANGEAAIIPRPKKVAPRSSATIWTVLITVLAGYLTWYRQEKFAVGYCGVGRPSNTLVAENVPLPIPGWATEATSPQCVPCPQHAYCYARLETVCEPDFVLSQHPLALGGLIPVVPTCEPDGEKARRVRAVADRAVEELRERRAKWECGDLADEAGKPEPLEIDATELKKDVAKKRRKGMGEAEFEDLWVAAMGEIEGREEVIESVEGHRRLLTSTSLARLPLKCAIRRSARLTLERNRLSLVLVGLLGALGVYARSKFLAFRVAQHAVPGLVATTLDKLATRAGLHAADPDAWPEAWIAAGQLRDDVLRSEHSLPRREKLWRRVRVVVERNANVRAGMREARSTGEVSRAWEWIGAVEDLAEDKAARRRSGRVSWGAYGDEGTSPVSGTDAGPEIVQSKWEESRPIY